MPALETDILAALISRKRECLVQLSALGGRQVEFIDRDDVTALLDVLSLKQRLLGDLQQVEKALEPFRGQPPESRQWRSEDQRRRCAEQLNDCQQILATIIRQEKESEQELVRRRDAVAARLEGTHLASQARDAYLSRSAVKTGHLDLLSDV